MVDPVFADKLELVTSFVLYKNGVIAATSLRDGMLWAVTGGALAFLGLVLYVPPIAALFHFAPLGAIDLALAFGDACASKPAKPALAKLASVSTEARGDYAEQYQWAIDQITAGRP